MKLWKEPESEAEEQYIDFALSRYECSDTSYLRDLVERYVAEVLTNPVENIFMNSILARDDIIGRKVAFHESIEVLEYLKRGFSEEEITTGIARIASYPEAHSEALFREHELCQYLARELFGFELPLITFVLVEPVIDLSLQFSTEYAIRPNISLEVVTWKDVELLNENPKYQLEKPRIEQVMEALNFYERMGYTYTHRDQILQCAEKYVKAIQQL